MEPHIFASPGARVDPRIGARIVALRRRAGVRQGDLAARARIPVVVLSRLELGKQSVAAERLRAIALALETTLDVLCGMGAVDVLSENSHTVTRAVCLRVEV